MAHKYFDVCRDGKDLRIRIGVSDLTVWRLSKAFKVDPDSLYLKEEFGERAFWPNESGKFNIIGQLTDGSSLEVMGEPATALHEAKKQLHTLQNPPANVFGYVSAPSAAPGTSERSLGFKKTHKGISIKIIHADMKTEKGSPTFLEKGQTFIPITEENANIFYLQGKAREAFNQENLELRTSNGLKINDSEGTRGLTFWKCPSRKIFAVGMDGSEKVHPKKSRKSSLKPIYVSPSEVSDDSDEEFVFPKVRKTRACQSDKQAGAVLFEIKSMVSDLLEVNSCLPLPLGVIKIIKDAFICKICHETPMKPPIIATKCCSSLLGCEVCVNTWYDGAQGLSKKCPHCNEARGYAFTHQFKGLDDFLNGIRQLMMNENSQQANHDEEQ